MAEDDGVPSVSERTASTIDVIGWCSANGCSQPGIESHRDVGARDEREREHEHAHALRRLGGAGDQADAR